MGNGDGDLPEEYRRMRWIYWSSDGLDFWMGYRSGNMY